MICEAFVEYFVKEMINCISLHCTHKTKCTIIVLWQLFERCLLKRSPQLFCELDLDPSSFHIWRDDIRSSVYSVICLLFSNNVFVLLPLHCVIIALVVLFMFLFAFTKCCCKGLCALNCSPGIVRVIVETL